MMGKRICMADIYDLLNQLGVTANYTGFFQKQGLGVFFLDSKCMRWYIDTPPG